MYRKLVKPAVVGGLSLFFLAIFGTFGYFLFTTAGKTSFAVTISMLVIFIIFIAVGLLMAFRAARMLTGDGTRISEYAFSSKDLSVQSSPPVAAPDEETENEASSAEQAIEPDNDASNESNSEDGDGANNS